jgi:paraquat-inducible protein B
VLIENLNTHLIPATSSAKNAFDHFNTLFEKDEISSTFSSIHDTMLDSRELIQNINQQIDPTADKFDMAMKEFSNAMYSVNALADYLSRHPEALIQGKAPSTEGKKP